MRSLTQGFGAIVTSLILILSACTTTNVPPLTTAASGMDLQYRLVVGDRLRVSVYDEKDLSGDFQIASDGTINLPLIGQVAAAGKTSNQLQDQLLATYRGGYLKNPNILVEVIGTRPFYIMGEVNKPGEYPTSQGLTISGAVAKAQGYTYRADQKKVFVRHNGEEQEYRADPTKPQQVLPGDVIRVGERYF